MRYIPFLLCQVAVVNAWFTVESTQDDMSTHITTVHYTPNCGPIPFLTNGFVMPDSLISEPGSTATVTCFPGYFSNSASITCQPESVWEIPSPCHKVYCGTDWQVRGSQCYYFSSNFKTWTAAETYCQLENGHLVKISSPEENALLRGEMELETQYWIGLNDIASEGTWVWTSDNSSLPGSYKFWSPGEPNNDGEEDCAAFRQCGDWIDLSCDVYRKFICERTATDEIWNETETDPELQGTTVTTEKTTVDSDMRSEEIRFSMETTMPINEMSRHTDKGQEEITYPTDMSTEKQDTAMPTMEMTTRQSDKVQKGGAQVLVPNIITISGAFVIMMCLSFLK